MHSITITLLVWIFLPTALALPQSLEEKWDRLNQEYKSSNVAWHEKYDDSKSDDESIARYRDWPGWTFAPRFVAFGESSGSSSEAFESLCELLKMGNSVGESDRELFAHYERALELLLANHRDKDLRPLCADVRSTNRSEEFLRTLMTDGESEEIRADACFYLGRLMTQKREMCFADSWAKRPPVGRFAEYLNQRTKDNRDQYLKSASIEQLYVEANRCFDRVVTDYSSVVTIRGDERLGDRAKREIFELKHLSVGGTTPDIDGRDLEDEPMRLNVNRGKVVLLVFWASWCGPCMGEVPHEKELHAKFAGRPFAIIGVNADKTLELARKAVQEHAIPWQSFWNGDKGANGPIANSWNVRGWPTVYVIDHTGTIRHKHLRGDELDEPLELLIREAETVQAKPE